MSTRATLTIALCAALSFGVRAENVPTDELLEAIASSGPTTVAVDRSWLYNDPTRVAAPGRTVAVMR
jgi:hypothetical protein